VLACSLNVAHGNRAFGILQKYKLVVRQTSTAVHKKSSTARASCTTVKQSIHALDIHCSNIVGMTALLLVVAVLSVYIYSTVV
jgi:hypothetical protein